MKRKISSDQAQSNADNDSHMGEAILWREMGEAVHATPDKLFFHLLLQVFLQKHKQSHWLFRFADVLTWHSWPLKEHGHFWRYFVLLQDFSPRKSRLLSRDRKLFFLCGYSSEHHGYILSCGQGKLSPHQSAAAEESGSSSSSSCVPGTTSTGHTDGSVKTVSRPHVVKEVVLVHFNGEFGHFLAKQLENNSLGIRTSVVTVCDQNRGPWSSQGFDICTDRRRCPSSFPLDHVYLQSWGVLYIKCNMVKNLKWRTCGENKLQVRNSATFNLVLVFACASEAP